MESCFDHILFNVCEFKKSGCEEYSVESYTCLHGGGKYCGSYRNKITEQLEKKHKC